MGDGITLAGSLKWPFEELHFLALRRWFLFPVLDAAARVDHIFVALLSH